MNCQTHTPHVLLTFVACLLNSPAALATEVESDPVKAIQQFYEETYNANSTASSLDHPERIYSPKLAKLIKNEQRKQQASGEIGQLSADPLCSCQDPTSVESKKFRLTPYNTPSNRRVEVELKVSGRTELITLHLLNFDGRWTVADVSTASMPSLTIALQANPGGTSKR